jgi:hypothetical protein
MPAGVLVTVPDPIAVTETLTCGAGEKVAVTVGADDPILKLQAPVPEQAPLQPANTDPTAGVALRATALPVASNALVHVPVVVPAVAVQLIPPVPVTVPLPLLAAVTVTGNEVGIKLALTDSAALIVTVQAPVPEQTPLQPLNTEPTLAVGVSVTTVPLSKSAAHVAPQEIPAGELLIDPEPVTDVDRVNFGRGAGPNVAVTF